jgi:RHS repeat-associated protein
MRIVNIVPNVADNLVCSRSRWFATQTETIGGAVTQKAYTYDLRGRLTSVTTDGSVTESYSYDLNGNRTNSMHGVAVYDAQDRLLTSGSAVFAYDANGNRVSQLHPPPSSLLTTYSYDLFGQLSAVTLPDGRVISYDLDALSRVTAKRINGVVTQGWIYKDGLKPIAETDAAGNIVSLFVYGTSALSPDYMIRDGATYRLIRDVQGSVRLVVNADTGAIAQRLDYDSFGNVSQDTNTGFQPFGFQSGLYDPETALVHFGARWYDAATGRWLSKDPILLAGGLNLYAFCENDPVNRIDPFGLDWLENAANFSAGFGDTISFGLTRKVRQWMGTDSVVSSDSGWYTGGMVAGVAHGLVMGGGGVLKGGAQNLRTLVSDPRKFTSISKAFWRGQGGAGGNALHHWLIEQSVAKNLPWLQSVANGGWNTVVISGRLNTWMGFAKQWGGIQAGMAYSVENLLRFLILGSLSAPVTASFLDCDSTAEGGK